MWNILVYVPFIESQFLLNATFPQLITTLYNKPTSMMSANSFFLFFFFFPTCQKNNNNQKKKSCALVYMFWPEKVAYKSLSSDIYTSREILLLPKTNSHLKEKSIPNCPFLLVEHLITHWSILRTQGSLKYDLTFKIIEYQNYHGFT